MVFLGWRGHLRFSISEELGPDGSLVVAAVVVEMMVVGLWEGWTPRLGHLEGR